MQESAIDPNLEFCLDGGGDVASQLLRLALPARPGHYNEMADAAGLRPAWRQFFGHLGTDAVSELNHQHDNARRQIRDNGVSYNVYADASGPSRPWPLGILPMLIGAGEWAQIEAGVAQRAALLNAMAQDIYGEQTLLQQGLLPPALVYGHPGYLRPLSGFSPPGGIFCHICAFDLARAPDGQWSVVAQRTQAPSGLGYALENRLIVSRLFAPAFREMQVQHLARSFNRLLGTLAQHSRVPPGERFQTVLLTPGRYNETYFEHAYLARYLGVPLVEGGDLTVRDDRLYLKTLSGLEPVHALLRRLDDEYCDPLVLRSDSALGVPGLLAAARAGNVLLANALGTSWLESPALHGFLPAISKQLLGAELRLPSLPSWWCGEPAALDDALADLPRHVLKATYPMTDFEPVMLAGLDDVALQGWRERVAADPQQFTLQDFLPLSQTPLWDEQHLLQRGCMLRVYTIADGQGGWQVLPGGLGRTAGGERDVVSLQRGGRSADVWVLTEGDVDTFSLLPKPISPEELSAKRRVVSSRAGENLFWLGRYSERAEYGVRLARHVLSVLNSDAAADGAWSQRVASLCQLTGLVPPGTPMPQQAPAVFERTLLAGLGDAQGHFSVAFNLLAIGRAADQIRERLSPEHARLALQPGRLLRMRLRQMAQAGRFSATEALPLLDGLALELAALAGEQSDRMTRDDGWRMLTLGRQLERLWLMSSTLQQVFALGEPQGDTFELLLAQFDCSITYRSLYQRQNDLAPLLDLLLRDPTIPRSLACLLDLLPRELAQLPQASSVPFALASIRLPHCPSLASLCQTDASGDFASLLQFVAQARNAASNACARLSQHYFSHAAPFSTAETS